METSVAKCPTTVSGEKSPTCEISNVRINDDNLSAQNLNGFLSMQTFFKISEVKKIIEIVSISTKDFKIVLLKFT